MVQLPGSKTFVDIDAARGIPMKSVIDARRGAIEIVTVPRPGAPPERATFSEGVFRTTGRYSAATVRGTRWLVEDTCTTTRTRVTVGSVLVTHGNQRKLLRAGQKPYVVRGRP